MPSLSVTWDTLIDLLPGLTATLLALFGGVGGALFLEIWYRPRRERRQTAALILHELNLTAQNLDLELARRKAEPNTVSFNVRFPRIALEAVSHNLARLPPMVASWVMHVYAGLDLLGGLASEVERAFKRAQAQTANPRDEQHFQQALASYDQDLKQSLEHTLYAMELLKPHAGKQDWEATAQASSLRS